MNLNPSKNIGRTMLALALATMLTSAIAQSTPKPAPAQGANPLAPAQVLVPAIQEAAPLVAAQDPNAAVAAAQAQANQTITAQSPPPAVVDPVAALQTVAPATATAPAAGNTNSAELVSPYNVPPAGPGIFQGSGQTFREISYLTAEVDLIDARTKREEALQKQAKAHADLADVVSGKKPGAAGASGGVDGAAMVSPEQLAEIRQAKQLELARQIAETPYINSVYMYGDKAYAEVVIGSTWTMATKGTVLISGDRVVDISAAGVVLSGKKGRRVLPVRGSASVN